MRKIQYSAGVRIIAAVLFVLFSSAAVFGALCIAYMINEGFYSDGEISFFDSQSCALITSKYTSMVYYDYLYLYSLSKRGGLSYSNERQRQLKQYEKMFSPENTNFMFTVSDALGRTVLSNHQPADSAAELTWSKDPEGWVDEVHGRLYYRSDLVKSYVRDITAKDDYYLPYKLFISLYPLKYAIIAVAALSVLLSILLFVFLMRSAGHKKDTDGIVLTFVDKIPFDLITLGVPFILFCLLNVGVGARSASYFSQIIVLCIAVVAASSIGIMLCMTFAARVKAGKWWRNTIIYRIFKLVKGLAGFAGGLVSKLPLLSKTIYIFLAYLFINGCFVIGLYEGGGAPVIIFGFFFNMAVLLGLCFLTLQLNRLKRGAEMIAAGDYDTCIETDYMFWDIRSHADTLNNIRHGMSKAVDERIKSERLKTELITNVSHDIKTPLTSIINYVDLLKKEKIDNENAREYLDILDNQSARLKKLTEDLVDASKAATGNISSVPEPVDISEFLNQSAGEYSERFAACGLELIMNTPAEKTEILADGRLLWRIFDNLLNNICKYAMPNTRVYVDVLRNSGAVTVTLKNISRYPLNITPDELMERFVRGDKSRTTEGSGLGLSIAKSLTELMKGRFKLSVDGDLFKVTIEFDSLIS